MKIDMESKLTEPKNQQKLYGYENYFDQFEKLYQSNKLPNSILLTGPKGIGKATFAYHFSNYMLSENESNKYNKKNLTINENNSSYRSVKNSIHTNLFTIDDTQRENIKIDQIRKLLFFLNKSSYNKNIKIVIIDNAEYLNLNSSNALLKAIEEPSDNTYFFIINNDSKKILDTIKSRCIDFKIYFNTSDKKKIFKKIMNDYDFIFTDNDINNFLHFDSHGNFLRYLNELKNSDLKISENYQDSIFYFLDLYKSSNDIKYLNFATIFIQNFYHQLSLKNNISINRYSKNCNKILYLINDMKKFNLDKKSLIFSINKIILNDNR